MIDLAREASFSLGGHDARPWTRELVVQGQPRVVEPRVMQAPVALARRRGEVVSRDELIGAWRPTAGATASMTACSRTISGPGAGGWALAALPEAPLVKGSHQDRPG